MSVTPKDSGLRPLREEALQQLFSVVQLDPRKQKLYPNPKQAHRWYTKKKEASERLKAWAVEYVRLNPKARALLKVKFSRPNIDKWLDEYPYGLPNVRAARKAEPAYISAFEATQAWGKLKDHKYADELKGTLTKAFKLLGQTEPATWTIDDFKDLRKEKVTRKIKGQMVTQDNTLYNANTKDIYPGHATNIRRAFLDLNLSQLTDVGLKDVDKGDTATRQDWYLRDMEIVALIKAIDDAPTLVFFVMELQCGSRPNAMVSQKVLDLHFQDNPPYMQYNETKNRARGQRYFSPATWKLIQLFISDNQLQPHNRLFPEHQDEYSKRIKDAGIRAGIPLFSNEGAAAYVIRHTFATQGSDHNISLEVVMKQGGWTEASTLMKHYLAIKRSKVLREILDIVIEKPMTFKEWIAQFEPQFIQRYYELTGRSKPVQTVTIDNRETYPA